MLIEPSPGDTRPPAADLPKLSSAGKFKRAPAVWWMLVAQLLLVIALIIILVI
jgi:hypothetical protein